MDDALPPWQQVHPVGFMAEWGLEPPGPNHTLTLCRGPLVCHRRSAHVLQEFGRGSYINRAVVH